MNLYLRFFLVLIASFFKPRIASMLDPSTLRLRCLPNDLDLNGHMNNGRYPALMDLGRLDIVLRSNLLRLVLTQKSVPVLASVALRFRLPLHIWQPFDLVTRIICWDEKWVYMEQRFVLVKGDKAGQVAAIALIKGGFYNRRSKSMISTADLLHAAGTDAPSPEFPLHINHWLAADSALKDVTRST